MRKLKGDSSKASEDIAPKCRQILRTFVFFLVGEGGGGGEEVEKGEKKKTGGGGGGRGEGGGGTQEVEKSVKEKTSEEWGENNFFALAFCLACPF